MCDMCKPLVNCNKYHKAKTIINPEIAFTDCFGETWVGEDVIMMINHDESTLAPYAFIGGGSAHRLSNPNVSYGNCCFDIQFCPFCGEKLY